VSHARADGQASPRIESEIILVLVNGQPLMRDGQPIEFLSGQTLWQEGSPDATDTTEPDTLPQQTFGAGKSSREFW
jgi:hypothetical protein